MATATKPTNRPAPPVFVPSEAADFLKISRRTLHDLTIAGEIPSIRLGKRCIRYPVAKLEAIVNGTGSPAN